MTKHMKPFTKSTLFSFMLCLAVLLAGVVTYLLRLSPNEKENDAISALSGYSFVYAGETNRIEVCSATQHFTKPHPMIEYLELVAQEFEKCDWPKDIPVEITETKTHIIVTWPSMPQILGLKNAFGAGYRKQVIIDKRTKKIISNLVGLMQRDGNFILLEKAIYNPLPIITTSSTPIEPDYGLPKEA